MALSRHFFVVLAVALAIAPAGSLVAQAPPALTDIWLHEPASSSLQRLTVASEPGRASTAASVSADGRLIAFHGDSDLLRQQIPSRTAEVWLYDVVAKKTTRVTKASEPGRNSLNPAVSADGATVVFDSDADLLGEGLPKGQREIWQYTVATGKITRLTRSASPAVSSGAAVNANGTVVAFQSNAAFDTGSPARRSREIWLLNVATGALTQVTTSTIDGRQSARPALDAAGHTLVFDSDAALEGQTVPAGQLEIWMYDVRAKALKRVTDAADPSRFSQAPSISADGKNVVFHSQADLLREGRPDSVDEIWFYDAAASKLERLTSSWVPARDAGTDEVRHPDCQNPRITADGRNVVFASDADFLGERMPNGYPHVWIYDVAAKSLKRVDTSTGSGSGLAISADASRIVLFRSQFDAVRASRVAPSASATPRPARLTPEAAARDLAAFQSEIEGRWAYLKANGVDHRAAIARLREKTLAGIDINEYGLELQKIISLFIDGHSSVGGFSMPTGSLPFFIETTADRYVAIRPDRSSLLDPDLPFVTRIDGRPVEDWITAAAPYSPQGSPQYKRYRALRLVRAVTFMRQVMGLPAAANVRVEVTSADRLRTKELDVPVAASGGSSGGTWPPSQSAMLDGNIGYLRVTSMDDSAVADIQTWMPKFRNTRGLIVDVRGNGGGLRGPQRALFPYLMSETAAPRVVNAAKYRLHPEYGADHLGGSRFMWVEGASEWTPAERAAIVEFKKTFVPEWTPPASEFSGWHYLVMSRKSNPDAYFYSRPVIVLLDEKCFSATDIFLSTFKGWTNVTLMGTASGGGSARQVPVRLPESMMSMTLASMASFQWTGKLYDTRGIEPEVVVHPDPVYFLTGGKDNLLAQAIAAVGRTFRSADEADPKVALRN